MIIMWFGFIYASCLVFGSNDSSFKNVGNAAQIVFFSTMSQFDKSTYEQANISKFISATFYVIFMILFTFVLMKMLITIVILR